MLVDRRTRFPESKENLSFHEISYDREKSTQSPSPLYRLAFLQSRYSDKGDPDYIPILLRNYLFNKRKLNHFANLDPGISPLLLRNTRVRMVLSSALTDVFWTLLHWDISPVICPIRIHQLRDAEDPDWKQISITIQIPRRTPGKWLDIWKDIEKQVYMHIPANEVAVLLERY